MSPDTQSTHESAARSAVPLVRAGPDGAIGFEYSGPARLAVVPGMRALDGIEMLSVSVDPSRDSMHLCLKLRGGASYSAQQQVLGLALTLNDVGLVSSLY